MVTTAWLLSLAFLTYIHDSNALSAQCHEPYITISEVWRSTANKISSDPKCDRGHIVDNGWYRFNSPAGNEMPTTNPRLGKCGTYAPIWMNGTHPSVADDVIDTIACAGLPRVTPLGCGVQYKIKVVNCSGFYLYRLKSPRQCSLAYCAGKCL